jgi:hypothetical protein
VGPGPRFPRHLASRGWKELAFLFQSCERREGEEPNRAPRVPSGWTALISPDTFVGPGPRFPRHLASRGWKELVFLFQSCERREGEEPNRAPRVPSGWTAEILSLLRRFVT